MRKCFTILGFFLLALSLNAQLTFILEQLPPNTPDSDTLFLAGDVNNWTAANPDFQFRRDSSGQYFLTIGQAVKIPFEYKFTRGSWERVETDTFGHFIDNRGYDGDSDTVRLKIMSWDDLPVNPKHGWATVVIEKLPGNTPPDASLYAVGNFNTWHTNDPAYKLKRLKLQIV